MLGKLLSFILLLTISFSLVACSSSKTNLSKEHQDPSSEAEDIESQTPIENIGNELTKEGENKVLVVYFSATGTTKTLAEYAADILGADIYEILPEIPYTGADLAYYTDGRADKEQNNPTARPAISGSVQNIEQYNTVLLSYPIWHGQAPRIISTFLESYDFSGKTILPFCTSHSSGIGSSATELQSLTKNAKWFDGKRFSADTSKEDIAAWLESNGLRKTSAAQAGKFDFDEHTAKLLGDDTISAIAKAHVVSSAQVILR